MTYDFSQLSAVVADSKPVMRQAVREVLSTFGFAQVHEVPDGLRAIEFLENWSRDPEQSDGSTVDMIFADLHLESLDGVMLARWLRRHENSPDRFMPFIMLGVGELHDAALARDAGISDFVVGSFSVDAFGRRIATAIDTPPTYVCTRTYFGPDRRNRASSRQSGERRDTEDDAAEVVESGNIPPFLSADGPLVRYYRSPNRLKDKVSGHADDDGDPIALTVLQAARDRIENLEQDFIDWVAQSVCDLDGLCRQAAVDLTRAPVPLRSVHRIGRALHSQGDVFDYPLITEFGCSLAEVSGAQTRPSLAQLDLIRAHAKCIGGVSQDRIRGDGGERGAALRKDLEKANRRSAMPAIG